jgi:hypothetical protein
VDSEFMVISFHLLSSGFGALDTTLIPLQLCDSVAAAFVDLAGEGVYAHAC